jgi:hypothetical protein
MKGKIILTLADFIMLNIAFWGTHWIKYQNLSLSPIHRELIVILWVLWVFILMLSSKLSIIERGTLWDGLVIVTKSDAVMIMLMSLTIISLRMLSASRVQAYIAGMAFWGMEMSGCAILWRWRGRQSKEKVVARSDKGDRGKTSVGLLGMGGILLGVSLITVNYFRRHVVGGAGGYMDYAAMLYGMWIIAAMMTNKYGRANFRAVDIWLSVSVKAAILMAGGMGMLIFGTRMLILTRFQVFGPLIIYCCLEWFAFYLYYVYVEYGGNIQDIENVDEVDFLVSAKGRVEERTEENSTIEVKDPVVEKLRNALEFLSPKLFEFIRENIDLSLIERSECVLISTDNLFNVRTLEKGNTRIFINLHRLNDMRWFNQYYLSVHSLLSPNGYLVGHVSTIETQKEYYEERYPLYIVPVVKLTDFVWNRVIPKLPVTKELYFALTKGRGRTVSMAEAFGRLYFCGFHVVAERVIDEQLYFVAQKVRKPAIDKNPTYGPIIRLQRYNGKNRRITVYKFRTMYPYSEYLQEYVYTKQRLQKGGKFKDDFRVTSWGRFLRKTWLDELPMIYNWLRGDLHLFGVRPLSGHYLSLYNVKTRLLRERTRPGLIPPFYADLPRTLDEIQESEKRYIEAYLRHPLVTQVKYLCKSCFNIIFKKARSG